MSAAAKLPASLERMKRMRDQGVPLDARTLDAIRAAETLNADDDDGAGEPGEVHRVAEAEHAHDCGCAECDANRAAVGVDCGQYDPEAQYRQGVFVTRNAARYRSLRATRRAPGESDDWEAVGPAPTAPPARASTKAKVTPPLWVKALVEEVRRWTLELLEPLTTRTAVLERKLAELKTKCAELENRSGATATASALADAYVGVHVDGRHYTRGQLCTFGGSLWLALSDTTSRPGRDETFRLVVKHGRDAKEAR